MSLPPSGYQHIMVALMEHPKGARVLTRIAAMVNEDIGQPLGFYGVGHGPYLVLPIPDPSNFRDTTVLVVDTVVYSVMINEH